MKKPYRGINPEAKPTGFCCEECLKTGGWWLHLRRCAECGHVGCCDSSPGQHAARHAAEAGHPVVASFEPLQPWFYDYETRRVFRSIRLASPRSHPRDQPVPGPEGKVPENWESLLHDVA
jgi:Zn-finger in ubiquitin-hydrolases and other protein